MKLYEAIDSIIKEFGKDIITNVKVINIFNDYQAFDESKTFKIIIKNIIAEGYMDQLMYIQNWSVSQNRIISNFITATSFNDANVLYVFQSLAYGLGYTKEIPVYTATSNPTQPSNSKQQTPQQKSSANSATVQGVSLDKTQSQVNKLSETSQRKYKEAAESYLESIVLFKTDFEKDLGAKINTYIEFDDFGNIIPKFEIDGKIKIKYDFSILFYVLLYDQNKRLVNKKEIYVGRKRSSFEVVHTCISPEEYYKVSNIHNIVVYWQED